MMGSGSNEQSMESSGTGSHTTNASCAASTKSDSSECEEEVASLLLAKTCVQFSGRGNARYPVLCPLTFVEGNTLAQFDTAHVLFQASTMEGIMKSLRLENSQLRRSLEESRSDAERLQSLVQKQDKEIAENILYIKELEDRERIQDQNVEELLTEIKETEAEVARWREACELEVEAAKKAIEEREKLVVILKQELEKTKANLDISNGKLKLKDELAVAATAAQAAAERSLQLADSRAAGLRQLIEELTRQVEEAETKELRCNKVRHICWPWRAIKAATANTANNRVQNVKRMLPEMQKPCFITMSDRRYSCELDKCCLVTL
ncbi:hypothetical protein SADUNF_Sadunf15G0121900 [Salix dunnii]|uniref:Uncharacterized protein n=1 Tax=Salix dunnii TaxID=1413687 RepID=A0A835JGP1_9ROSI|nr:hypothetical protein SADUNF_Sadunf15G0121900 [Salix dunnii]